MVRDRIGMPAWGRWMAALATILAGAAPARAAPLELREGDHVCIIGGGLADRMQHTGWLEVRLHSRFPGHRLVIRNLAVEGDEIDPAKRLRSEDFGNPDQWLAGSAPIPKPGDLKTRDFVRENRFELAGTGADVILAFFGSNEAHAGPAGLDAFRRDLDAFITHTRAQQYNGVDAPRLVMFSPIAHEDLGRPHWPDGEAHNANLRLYTEALEQVCAANGVACVDLLTPTAEAYAASAEPLTTDGIHPNERGDREISRIIDESLFGAAPVRDPRSLARLQQAVADKNFFWFHRYRVTDGYSTFGGRAWLKFEPDQQSNYEVAQRELEYLDVKTANRDRRIWATAATLGDAAAPLPVVEDVGLPEFLPVKTNKPGPLPGGRHAFLSGEEAIARMTVHAGMKVELVADEERFPELVNPVAMSFDARGRLWVAAWGSYPHWRPNEPMDDKILILEDADGDGRTDRVKTFAGDLHNPIAFEFWGKGVIVSQAPGIVYLEDTDGDDVYDVKTPLVGGLDTADTHHASNSFTLDPAGALYFQEGVFQHSQPETPWGPPVRVANGAVFRLEPRTGRLELYTSYAFANPHGHVFDRWGDDHVVDGTMSAPYWGSVFSTRLDGMDKHANAPTVYKQRTRPCPGIEILSSPHFPPALQGNLLVGNVISFQGILQYAFKPGRESFPEAVEVEPILSSSDPNFRPADLEVGPDGALYFTDWQNPVIGHMQHNLRDPSRDRTHGRVYRVVMADRPTVTPTPIAGRPVAEVVALLADPTDRVRYRARLELSGRPEAEVVPAVRAWLAGLDPAVPDHEHHRLEAAWMLRHFDAIDLPLLEAVLTARDPRSRTAGMRMLSTIHARVPNALDLVRRAAADDSPRVRLEAVRTATFLRVPEAVEALAIAEEFPSDRFMDYVRQESRRVLDPEFRRARESGRSLSLVTDAGRRYLYRSLDNDELVREPRSAAVHREMLLRGGLDERLRAEAIDALATAEGTTPARIVAEALATLDAREGEIDVATVSALIRGVIARSQPDLAGLRADLEKLATSARQPVLRRIGYVSLMTIDAAADDPAAGAWHLAAADPRRLIDLVNSLPLLEDSRAQAGLQARILPLVDVAAARNTPLGVPGRFVRVELTGSMRTLWLDEVEAHVGDTNVAPRGKAAQKQPPAGPVTDAGLVIDGRFDPQAAASRSGPSPEDPWWEVDLGSLHQLTRIVVRHSRGILGERLRNFTLVVLDGDRRQVFSTEAKANSSLTFEVPLVSEAGRQAVAVRRAAMEALAGVRGREAEAFRAIAPFVREGVERDAAIAALQRIPVSKWPAEEAGPLVDALVASMKAAPPEARSTDEGLAAWQFAESLTTLVPAADGKARRAILADLGVRVVRIGTVPERMAYDKETVAVQAGRPVLFVLDNADVMPHNFVITKPGRMQTVGELAEASAQDPAFARQHFVPRSADIVAASTLMQPRGAQRITLDAPAEPGVYPYVCTYPGHWRRMFGALYVVEDLEAYLADPAAYLAAHPLDVKDELLKDRRPRTEWTLVDLQADLSRMEKGRSFVHGRELFRTSTCIACHRMGDAGHAFGPDLTKLDAAMTPVEIARHILEPSLRIEEKYRATTIVTDDGRSITGLVVEETPAEVALVANPVAKSEPVRIRKDGIDERVASPVSIMPKGLLDKLTRDEVLDLVAYVAARGRESDCLFNPDGCPLHDDRTDAAGPRPAGRDK